MRIGVTGATGFLGGRLAPALAIAGHDVTGFGRNPERGNMLVKQGVRFLPVDLSDHSGLAKSFEGLDLVIHSAALSSVWGTYAQFHAVNVIGTENVIKACRSGNVRKLIYISSSSVYFDYRDRFGISEEQAIANPPPSAYTRSKIAAEAAIKKARDMNWIILRPRGIFGPGDSSIVPRALRIARKGWFPLVRQGDVMVDLTYVGNLVDLLEYCVKSEDGAWNQIYNVSNGEPVRIVDFFDELMRGLELSPKKVVVPVGLMKISAAIVQSLATLFQTTEPPLTRYTVGLLSYHQTLDISKSQELLNYAPKISIGEGLQRTVESLMRKSRNHY